MRGQDRRSTRALEKLLGEFSSYLVEGGLKESTASLHARRIEVFGRDFILGRKGKSPIRASPEDIEEFIGDWYIRRFLDSKKEDIGPMLNSLRRFYSFLGERRMGRRRIRDILGICRKRERYVERFEAYMALRPGDGGWEAVLKSWPSGVGGEGKPGGEFAVEEGIEAFLKEHRVAKLPVLGDFRSFSGYLAGRSPVRLRKRDGTLPVEEVAALNDLMSAPEDLPKRPAQHSSHRIDLFFHLCIRIQLFFITSRNELDVTPLSKKFFELADEAQYWLLFATLWNELHWSDLIPQEGGEGAKWVMADRNLIALYLSRCPEDSPCPFGYRRVIEKYPDGDVPVHIGRLSGYSCTIFEERILPALKVFGLVDFGYKSPRNSWERRFGWGVEWFKVTPQGKAIFSRIAGKPGPEEEAELKRKIKDFADLLPKGIRKTLQKRGRSPSREQPLCHRYTIGVENPNCTWVSPPDEEHGYISK
ncbi:MAG: hypothetical protein ACUVXI_20040 [bacterium]